MSSSKKFLILIASNLFVLACGVQSTGGQHQHQHQDMLMIHEREFVSPLVRVQMECAGKLETSECKVLGNGTKLYELQVQHNSTNCDTQWDNGNNSIFNTLFIRFHNSLETGSDIAKNVVCRLTVGDLIVGKRPQTNKTTANSKLKLSNNLLPELSNEDVINIEASVSPPISNLYGIATN